MHDAIEETYLAYVVQKQDEQFEVCATSGRAILVCDDEGSASHYASLLNDAYRSGYMMGYRYGRKK